MSRDQWARRAAILFVVTGCGSGLSFGCAEEPDDGAGGRPGRGGTSGVGAADGSTFGGTSGASGSAGVGGFGGSIGGSSGAAGAGAAGTGGVDAGSGGTNGASGTGGETGSGGSSGSTGTAGTGGNDAGADASTGGTNGSAGSSGTAGTGGSVGADASTGGTNGTAGTNGSGGTAGVDAGTGGTNGSAGTTGSGGTAGVDAGTGGTNGTAGTAGTGGTAGVDAGTDAGTDAGGCIGGPTTAPGFTNLAPPMGTPLDPAAGNTLNPPPPTGWTWYQIQGTACRDGSPAGFFVRFTSSDKLFVYLEGGGACTNAGFCNFNPPNVNSAISGDGQTVIGSVFGVVQTRQQPGVFTNGALSGIFDATNSANPFRDWNAVYIPYCTGDVFAGTKTNAMVPGVSAPQQFVGHLNMEKFIGRIVPTFKPRVNRVVITGASAGSFGAALNFSMLQDAFGCVKVDALLDSGMPFTDTYMPVCMQQRWRNAWGLNAGLPPDCTECQQADGGGFIKYADFLIRKHPRATIAAISSTQDEVIRLFFSMGLRNCASYDTTDPVQITLGQFDPTVYYPAADYTAGMNELRARYVSTGRFATYFLGGPNITFHQHTFRSRFFDPAAGTKTIAAFTTNFLNGTFEQIGP